MWRTECYSLIACTTDCTVSSAMLRLIGWQTVTEGSERKHTSATSVAAADIPEDFTQSRLVQANVDVDVDVEVDWCRGLGVYHPEAPR
jgi:hypothetical protein